MSLLNARVAPSINSSAGQSTEPRRESAHRLRPLTTPTGRRRPKLAYAALAVSGALVIGAAQIVVSVASTQDAFVLAKLNGQQHELNLQKQALGDEVAGLNSPQALAARADAMGLVVVGSMPHLRLSDGAMLGTEPGVSWNSTVTPNGATRVGNALLAPPPALSAEEASADASAQEPSADSAAQAGGDPDLPPAITDGLPSPTTR